MDRPRRGANEAQDSSIFFFSTVIAQMWDSNAAECGEGVRGVVIVSGKKNCVAAFKTCLTVAIEFVAFFCWAKAYMLDSDAAECSEWVRGRHCLWKTTLPGSKTRLKIAIELVKVLFCQIRTC